MRASACSPAFAEAFSIVREIVLYAIRLPLYHDATVQDNRNQLAFTLDDRISCLLQQHWQLKFIVCAGDCRPVPILTESCLCRYAFVIKREDGKYQ